MKPLSRSYLINTPQQPIGYSPNVQPTLGMSRMMPVQGNVQPTLGMSRMMPVQNIQPQLGMSRMMPVQQNLSSSVIVPQQQRIMTSQIPTQQVQYIQSQPVLSQSYINPVRYAPSQPIEIRQQPQVFLKKDKKDDDWWDFWPFNIGSPKKNKSRKLKHNIQYNPQIQSSIPQRVQNIQPQTIQTIPSQSFVQQPVSYYQQPQMTSPYVSNYNPTRYSQPMNYSPYMSQNIPIGQRSNIIPPNKVLPPHHDEHEHEPHVEKHKEDKEKK